MYADIKVNNGAVSIHVYSGWNSDSHVKLMGATYPIVPAGTIVSKLSIKPPKGLQGIAFFCKVEEPRRMGSGKTAYLDDTPQLSASVLLSWEEGDKLIVKADEDMSASELAKFNSFVRLDVDVLVTDTNRKIAYVSNLPAHALTDLMWTYKSVAMEAILQYITKKLTLEDLDQRATAEQHARDELVKLRKEGRRLDNENKRVFKKAEELYDQVQRLKEDNRSLVGMLTGRWFYKLLKHFPAKFRTKAFDDFVKAIDSVTTYPYL